jgi:outer membrane protein assembly factor BamB
VNRRDGKLAWKFMLEAGTGPGPKTSHATPVIWKDQVVLNRPGSVSAHSLADGSRIWSVAADGGGTSTLAADDDSIYAAAYSIGADPEGAVEPEPFAQAVGKYDANGDGALSKDECPDKGLYLRKRPGVPDDVPGAHFTIKLFFGFADGDKNGQVDEGEYNRIFEMLKNMPIRQSGLLAIRPDGEGDLSLSAVKWNEPKGTPEVPAPLAYRGRVYTISNGGILTCVEARSGRVLYRGRVRAPGAYYASPVAAGGRVVVASSEGIVTVLGGGESLEVQSNNDLGEPVFGTPAPGKSALYVRSLNHLWAFGTGQQIAEARGRER